MSKPKIVLFFDIRSGFTYLAFNVLRHSRVFKDVDVSYVPVDLYALCRACNNQGAWPVKNKTAWIFKSAKMWATKFGIPLAGPPEAFPNLSTTKLQQALCVVAQEYPEHLPNVMHAILEAFWVRREPAYEIDVFVKIFQETLGVEEGMLVKEKV